MVPLSRAQFEDDIEQGLLEVLRSGHIAQGPAVARFEEMVAAIAGTRHCIAVSNGTVALIAAMQALGIGPGDEVITSPFTFVATLNAILTVGATARFADIDADDFLLRADTVEALVNQRTRAIMAVHLYGQTADMGALGDLAKRQNLLVIEDAAQALGATHADRPAGSFGAGCFSFYATKNVTTGEGGAITTDDDSFADSLRVLRNQGMRSRYDYATVGSNLRMTDLQAAIGIPQLARIDEINGRRRSNAAALDAVVGGVAGLQPPTVRPGNEHVFHQYTVRVLPQSSRQRDDVARQLHERGIETGVYYPRPVFDYHCFRDHPGVAADHCPVAAAIATQVLSLPVHHHLSATELDRLVGAIAGMTL